jgi:hypothetical protein
MKQFAFLCCFALAEFVMAQDLVNNPIQNPVESSYCSQISAAFYCLECNCYEVQPPYSPNPDQFKIGQVVTYFYRMKSFGPSQALQVLKRDNQQKCEQLGAASNYSKAINSCIKNF